MRTTNQRDVAKHNELGHKGEQLAVEFLTKKGYAIIKQNFRFDRAEVDIIALKDDMLVVVEVKARNTNEFGNPQDFLKPKQINRIIKAVDHYITLNALTYEVRFDIIAILKDESEYKIEHLKNAFYHF